MKWSLQQLQKYRANGMQIDEQVLLDDVTKRNPEIRAISPVQVQGFCTIGARSMTCHFKLSGTMTLPDARTWEDVEYPFSVESDEQFSWDDLAEKADEVHAVSGEIIDPTPVFEEMVLLEVPMQVFNEDENAPEHEEGNGWSFSTEEAFAEKMKNEKPKVDPRLADLAKYFDQSEE
ncbi:YceD family protein [Chungangia koreensis]|uniref:YceD family protein n=1 Tax=Chungangia koreensis TaxID=752657 RepID=A0ABV8X2I0_9LACT